MKKCLSGLKLFLLILALVPSASAASAFTETNIGVILSGRAIAESKVRELELELQIQRNQTLLNSIAIFASEHQGLVGEPSCNGRPYPMKIGNEPWYNYQSLKKINPRAIWEIMNCDLAVQDGTRCTLNYFSRYKPANGRPIFHCHRGNEFLDFSLHANVTNAR